jgi:hypothetical protein
LDVYRPNLEDIYGGSNLNEHNILIGDLIEQISTIKNHEELSNSSTSKYMDTSK